MYYPGRKIRINKSKIVVIPEPSRNKCIYSGNDGFTEISVNNNIQNDQKYPQNDILKVMTVSYILPTAIILLNQ